ncbi:MAG: hypothetical protein JSR36_11760 [Proteobacteria bacterium]|nr:hypothetical protein [Pseudomonadota bacterium]
MTAPAEVLPIFATPFGVVTLAGAAAMNPELEALFRARALPAWGATDLATPAHAFHSREDLADWPEAPVVRLVEDMLSGVTAVATAVSELTPEQLAGLRREARCRFSVIGGDGYVAPHSHANTAWTAVYCVASPPASPTRQDSGVLRLHEFRPGGMFMDAAQASRMPYRPGHCVWRPVPGQMAVFPASITHEIALLRADSPLILVTARVRYVGLDQPWMPPW